MALNKPLVSVCMPAYNAGKYISEAIQSVIDQTYTNWELIIVNDGSTDNTASVAESFIDKRIKVLHQNNKGQCAAANKAFANANGNLIKFFDADDILAPLTIESQVKKLNGATDSVVSAKWGRFYNDDLTTFNLNKESVWRDMPADEWLVESFKNAQAMMQCGLWLIPQNIINAAGTWDERLSLINDLDFFTRILVNSKMVLFAGDAGLYYRSGVQNSLSGTTSRKGFESAYLSMEKATFALLNRRNDNDAKLACANTWQSFVYWVYPQHPDLVAKAKQNIKNYGGATLKFNPGGYSGKLQRIIGWKLLKKIRKWI